MGPSDGAFDPSAIEVPVRVAGVTRTVPGGLSQAGPCLSRAPGVADKTGACPELVEARPPRTGQRPVRGGRDEALARGARLPPDEPPWSAGA